MLCLKENCQYFSGVVRRFLGITIWSSEKSALCYFNHLGLFKRRKWPFAVEDEPEAVKKYLGRRSIEVFCKEAKPRLGLGQEQGHSFAAQVFSVVQTFFRYSLLAYLLEHDEQSQTIGDLFRQLEEETGKITFLERLRQYLSALLGRVFYTLAHFYDPSPTFRAYLDVITNAFNKFPILPGCER